MPVIDDLAVLEAVAADEVLAQRHATIMVTGQTGAASHGRIKELRDKLGIPLIGKPFTADQLLHAVAEAAATLTG